MVNRYDRIDHLLAKLIDSDTLTNWEYEFIESVSNQFSQTYDLSDKQIRIIKNIERKDSTRR